MENQIIVAVKGIIIFNNRALILRRCENDEIDGGVWEGVGGKVEFGEDLEHALVREVKEEAGLDITVGKLLYATTFLTDPERQVVILTYKCYVNDDHVVLSEEHDKYRWVSKEELRETIFPPILSEMDKYDVFPELFNK